MSMKQYISYIIVWVLALGMSGKMAAQTPADTAGTVQNVAPAEQDSVDISLIPRTRELAHRAAAEKQPGRHVKTENTHVAASLKKGAERLPCTSWIFDMQASVYTTPNNIIIANCGFKEKSKIQRKWSEYLVHYAKKNYAKNA